MYQPSVFLSKELIKSSFVEYSNWRNILLTCSNPAIPTNSECVVAHSVGQEKNGPTTFITIAFPCFPLDLLLVYQVF